MKTPHEHAEMNREWALDTSRVVECSNQGNCFQNGSSTKGRVAMTDAITPEQVQRMADFLSKARYLHHPEVPYMGTANGDNEVKWLSRLHEAALRTALAQQADCITTGVCVKSGLYCPPAQQAEQAGWVRVPVEPTQEMINAGRTTPMPSDSEFDEDEDYRAVFIAMVAAAPKGGL